MRPAVALTKRTLLAEKSAPTSGLGARGRSGPCSLGMIRSKAYKNASLKRRAMQGVKHGNAFGTADHRRAVDIAAFRTHGQLV